MKIMIWHRPLVYFCATTALAAPVAHAANTAREAQLSTGLYWSRGDYGEDTDTTMTAIPLAARVRTPSWTARVATTVLTIDGPSNSRDGVVVTNVARTERQSGLGDTWLSATYHDAPHQAGTLFIDVTGKFKWPTGDDAKGLSTGTTDTDVRIDAFKRVDNVTLSSGIGYRWRNGGDADYDNSANAIVGLDRKWVPGVNVGASVSGAQAATATSSGPREWLVYWSAKRPGNTRWMVYALHGLSTASPDVGIGITLSRTLDPR